MLPISAALGAEYAPNKTRAFWVSFVMSGYPLGATLSGTAAAEIIPKYGWQAMFQTAGVCTLLAMPLMYFFLLESLDFLLKAQPKDALNRANHILARLQQPTLDKLPTATKENLKKVSLAASISLLFTPERRESTIRLWIALLTSFATLYYLTAWIPKLASQMGLDLKLAIYAGMVFNLGAWVGIITQGFLSGKFGLQRTIFVFLTITGILMMIFSFFKGSSLILIIFGLIGFALQGGFVGLYALAARLYPTEIRSTGVGWGMGLGRIGAIISPILGGYLTQKGVSTEANFIIFAIPAIIAGIATMSISNKSVQH
jgi:MFS family permease